MVFPNSLDGKLRVYAVFLWKSCLFEFCTYFFAQYSPIFSDFWIKSSFFWNFSKKKKAEYMILKNIFLENIFFCFARKHFKRRFWGFWWKKNLPPKKKKFSKIDILSDFSDFSKKKIQKQYISISKNKKFQNGQKHFLTSKMKRSKLYKLHVFYEKL